MTFLNFTFILKIGVDRNSLNYKRKGKLHLQKSKLTKDPLKGDMTKIILIKKRKTTSPE